MDLRPSPIAGSWYPSNPARLRREIERYLANAHPPSMAGRLWGLLVPHAGLRYSGPVAAWAFAAARGLTPDLVVIVAPWHQRARAPLLTSDHAAYTTPLGNVIIDGDAMHRLDAALLRRGVNQMLRCRNDDEHAIEIELPFLQCVLGAFRCLPIMLGDQSAPLMQCLGAALAETLVGSSALLVASSDLSHYQTTAVARRLDAAFLERVAAFDPVGVISAEDEGVGYACGSGAIAAVLWVCRALGADCVSVVCQGTSGDAEPATPWVVGYGAAVIWQRNAREARQSAPLAPPD